MHRVGVICTRVGLVLFAAGWLVATILGYQGTKLAGLGNILFFLTLIPVVPLIVVGVALRIVGGRRRRPSRVS